VEEACWVTIEEAVKKLAYASERQMMRKAVAFFEKRASRGKTSEAQPASRG